MTIADMITDKKIQYDINREAAKISALASGKIDKYEYFAGKEILPSDQSRIIEEAKFTCSPLGKAFEKQIKTIQDVAEKQTLCKNQHLKSINNLFSRDFLTKEAKDEVKKLKL